MDALAWEYVGWSTYNYVLGNPIKFVDPDGRGVDTTRIYNSEGVLAHTINDSHPNQEHFLSDAALALFNRALLTSDTEVRGSFARLLSFAYIGGNTRQQMRAVSLASEADKGLERGFVLISSGEGRELQVKEVNTQDRTTNQGRVMGGTRSNVIEPILGYGHTHTDAGYSFLYGKAAERTIEKFNIPTQGATSTKDYGNLLDGVGNRASVQFIVTPMGYTIYSSVKNNPNPGGTMYVIPNRGNVFNYKGDNVVNY